jgi:hypothetical protein
VGIGNGFYAQNVERGWAVLYGAGKYFLVPFPHLQKLFYYTIVLEDENFL